LLPDTFNQVKVLLASRTKARLVKPQFDKSSLCKLG
jgi:hypothetical protein